MPALQVRDFPAGLYEELKECAALNHRSIAQQTVIAVEEMLAAFSDDVDDCRRSMEIPAGSHDGDGGVWVLPQSRATQRSFAPRKARSEKREELFREFDEIRWGKPSVSTEDVVSMVREGRDHLSNRAWNSLDPFNQHDMQEGGDLA